MNNITSVPYEKWLELISIVVKEGISSKAFGELQVVYPVSAGDSYDAMIYNQLAKLEEALLKDAFHRFEKDLNLCMAEMDLEILEKAVIKYKRHIISSIFFLQIPEYPESVRKDLREAINNNISLYIDAISKYIRKLEYYDNGLFVQDVVYICRKKIIKANILGV